MNTKERRNAKARAERAKKTPEQRAFENRRQHLWQKYKLTISAFGKLLDAQDGVCAICGTDEPGGKDDNFHVDHDHATDKVRGLLCINCNNGLGNFRDDPDLLDAAVEYLRLHS